MGLLTWLRGERFPKQRTPQFYVGHANDMAVKQEKLENLSAAVADLQKHKPRYERVADNLHIPWQLVAALHYGRNLGDFRRDLDTGRTLSEVGFKSWEESAIVTIGRVVERFTGNYAINGWSYEEMLALAEDFSEYYHGMDYYKHNRLTPFLWSWTSNYAQGVLTGNHYDKHGMYHRCGVAPLVQMLYICEGAEMERL